MNDPQSPHKRRTPCCSIEAHRYLDNMEDDHDAIARQAVQQERKRLRGIAASSPSLRSRYKNLCAAIELGEHPWETSWQQAIKQGAQQERKRLRAGLGGLVEWDRYDPPPKTEMALSGVFLAEDVRRLLADPEDDR